MPRQTFRDFGLHEDPFDLNFGESQNNTFNTITGAISIFNEGTATPSFSFDPSKNLSFFGGQAFAGRIDPAVFQSLSDEDFTEAEDFFLSDPNLRGRDEDISQRIFERAIKNAGARFSGTLFFDQFDERLDPRGEDIRSGKAFSNSGNPLRNEARTEKLEELMRPFFEEARTQQMQRERSDPGAFAFLNDDSKSPEVRQAILDNLRSQGQVDPELVPTDFSLVDKPQPNDGGVTDEQLNEQFDVDANRNFSLEAFSNARDRLLESNLAPQERKRRLDLLRERFDGTTINEPAETPVTLFRDGSPLNAQQQADVFAADNGERDPNIASTLATADQPQPATASDQNFFSPEFEQGILDFGKSFLDLFAQPSQTTKLAGAFEQQPPQEQIFGSSGSNIIQPSQSNIGPTSKFGIFAPNNFDQETGDFSGK